jgi:O-glycosyl hydrolase
MGYNYISQKFNIKGSINIKSITPYSTIIGTPKGLLKQQEINVSDGSFKYSLPKQSVTTFVSD